MATTTTINSNYRGQAQASPIIAAAIAETNAIEKGLFTVVSEIEGYAFVRKIVNSIGFQDYACGWLPNGSVALSEVELKPKKLMLEEDWCKEIFRGNSFDSYLAGPSAWSKGIPGPTQDAILNQTLDMASAEIDRLLYYGNSAVNGEFDGIIPQLVASTGATGTIRVTGTAVTAANVIAEIGKVVDAIPASLYGEEDLVIQVSQRVARAYTRAMNALGYKETYFANQEDYTTFDGVRLEMVNALSGSTMLALQTKNAFFGTSLQSDLNEIRVKDMDDQDLSGNIRVKMVFAADTAIAFPSEVVLYS